MKSNYLQRFMIRLFCSILFFFISIHVWAQLPTAQSIAGQMKSGWNLGNTLEAICGETAWGSAATTQRLIDSVRAAGFNTVRIPCAWDCHTANGVIDPTWIARVKQIVDYCINDSIYVILNIHWDGGWLENNVTTSAQTAVNAKQKNYWTQIASYFSGYNEHLLFASANEPNVSDATGMSVLLSYHQTFINAVRATGGNNSSRTLIIQGPSADIMQTNTLMNTMPGDPIAGRLIVEVHYYSPYQYCLMDQDASWGKMFYYWGNGYHSTTDVTRKATWGEEAYLDSSLALMKSKFVDKGIPVIIGEYAVGKRNLSPPSDEALHLASRLYYYRYFVGSAKNKGIIPFCWDTNMGIFDRGAAKVLDQDVVNAITRDAGAAVTDKAPAQSVPTDDSVYRAIERQIKKMTLEEKVGMLHASSSFTSGGVPRLGIPELTTSDGPHGVRMEHGRDWRTDNDHVYDSATYLPTGVCLASTWDPALGYAYGSVLGSEANARGKDVILGPGINIIRTPLNGRNFEYQSEDPYLVSKMAVGYIKGVQDQDVAACVKHFLANNQETERDRINVIMSERALREIYLPGFKAAVTEGQVYSVMGAYNKFRGEWCTENAYLVKDILKGEFKFKGLLMSDWGAVHNTMEALWNGTDLEMGTDLMGKPYDKFFLGDTVISLVKKGVIDEKLVDEKVRRILYAMHRIHKFGGRKPGAFSTKEHFAIARKVAEEGIVLLKNDNILPLKASGIKKIAVIGVNAARLQSEGGGSSQVRTRYEITLLEGLKNLVGNAVDISYSPGYAIVKKAGFDQRLIDSAVAAARHADVVIFAGGWTHGYNNYSWTDNAYDAEGTDKPDMTLPFGQDRLIDAIVNANPNTVVVLMGGGPVDMTAWIGGVPAVIQAWYAGSEGGNALAKILFGIVNPSGKLPMTFPKHLAESPAHALGQYPGDSINVHYADDIFVGYRYFDTWKVRPQFAFGHGLSYTTFSYADMQVTAGNQSATVSITVSNTGKVPGAEIIQVYVRQEVSELQRPEKELKGFVKIFLQPGESKKLKIPLEKDAFQYYNDLKHKWVLEPGAFTILCGSASDDIRASKILRIN